MTETITIITNGTERVILADEPVFLIRGQDIVGGDAVRAWCDLARKEGASPDILHVARTLADRMDEWPKKKIPDLKGDYKSVLKAVRRRHDERGMDAVSITKGFDPTRPCQFRNGSAVCELLHLKRPLRGGFNMISIDRQDVVRLHHPNGEVYAGNECANDLINISEEVTVERRSRKKAPPNTTAKNQKSSSTSTGSTRDD